MNINRSATLAALAVLLVVPSVIAAASGYEIQRPTANGDGASWQALNQRQAVLALFDDAGLRVAPEATGQSSTWSFGLEFLRYGRPGYMIPALRLDRPAPVKDRIEYELGNLVEWFVNRPEGLEHGFDIHQRPAGPDSSELVFELGLETDLRPVFSTDGQAVEFFRGRELALRYSKLVVTDSRGERLRSHMEGFSVAGERGIRLVVDDLGAHYPITVDPIVTTTSWSIYGPNDGAGLGYSVAAAGDVNGDGYGDVIVGATGGANGQSNEGMAFVYLGSPSGLQATPTWTMEGDVAGANCGLSVSTAGDLNADGYADIVVGCPYHPGGGSFRGQVRVYYGSLSGPLISPAFTIDGTQDFEVLGAAVSTAGDFNNDGYSDIVIGQPGYDSSEGRATIYTGGATGLLSHLIIDGVEPQASMGAAVAGGGDFDGDGYSDVAIGSPNGPVTHDGQIRIVLGAAAGSGGTITQTHPDGQLGTHFGAAMAFVGDTTGDQTSDLAVTSFLNDNDPLHKGKVWVFFDESDINTYWSAVASTTRATVFGNAVAAAGDVDDDGLADVVVGDKGYNTFYSGRAEIVQFPGANSSGDPIWDSQAVWTPDLNDQFGFSVAATDVNGDGRPDMIVGALGQDELPDDGKGAVMVFHSGPADGKMSDVVSTPSMGYGQIVVGDLNGDGFQDVAEGDEAAATATIFHGSASGVSPTPSTVLTGMAGTWFGRTFDGAGDVNGDGYEDLLVSAPLYDGTQPDEGQVSLFLGSATGVAVTPAWTFEPGQAGVYLGYEALTGLGDVNGDGFADVGIGALNWSGGEAFEGAVFVFHGSAAGLSTTYDLLLQANVADAAFGSRLDSAGDVNGDGYSDLLVATPYYDNGEIDEGAAFLYLGGPGGLNSAPVWQTESNNASDSYGWYIAGAGDTNGDGYADIAISAPLFTTPNDGYVSIFNGGPFGPSLTPDQVLQGVPDIFFGSSLDAPGDINGDGFTDLVMGRLTLGETGIYFGSAAGFATTPGSTLPFIGSVSGGDINGDGYADVVRHSSSEINVYYSHGTIVNPQDRTVTLRRENAQSIPIAPLGSTDDDTQVRFRANPPNWIGRTDARVEVEIKPYGVPLDGTGTIFLPWRDNNANIVEQLDSLTPGTLYHWRNRHWYDPIKFPGFAHGPWLPSPNNAWSEPDFRTSGNATASAVPDGKMIAGTPLTIQKVGTGPEKMISLDWGESCGGEATDYAIYIGTIGDYTSHVPCTCSTAGLSSFAYPPDPIHSQYYLVVPVNTAGQREGNYGADSSGLSRPASLAACYPTGSEMTCSP